MTEVLIVSTTHDCLANSALLSERIPHDIVVVKDDYDYGRAVHEYWERGKSFILLEHDIVPWPGAIHELMECGSLWCTFQYPVGHSGSLQTAIGIVKFSEELIALYPDANFGWDQTPWNHLDAQIYGALQVDNHIAPHIHTPPVAHLTTHKMTLAEILAAQ